MSLIETRKGDVITVSCQHCGTALAEIEDGREPPIFINPFSFIL